MSRTTFGFLAAGVVAVSLPILAMTTIGARAAPLSGATQDSSIDTAANTPTDFSSRGRGGGGGGRGGFGGGGRGGGFGGGGRMGGGGGRGGHVSGRTGGGRTGQHHAGRTGGGRTGSARTGGTRTGTGRTGGARTGTARTGGARTGTAGRVGGARVGTAGRVGGARVGTVTSIRGRRVTTFTGRRFWWHGRWVGLVGIGLLTPWVVGGIDYYPEGYLAYSEPVCTGYLEDGCALRWQDVAADDGSTIPQCVKFCPKVRNGPPPGAQLAPAPVAAGTRKGCEVEVFSDKNLQGQSFKTTDDQPLLNDQWNKQISSINVISGTWDFSTDPQFTGDAMRLEPGTYKDLGPNWDNQISSFMCAK